MNEQSNPFIFFVLNSNSLAQDLYWHSNETYQECKFLPSGSFMSFPRNLLALFGLLCCNLFHIGTDLSLITIFEIWSFLPLWKIATRRMPRGGRSFVMPKQCFPTRCSPSQIVC